MTTGEEPVAIEEGGENAEIIELYLLLFQRARLSICSREEKLSFAAGSKVGPTRTLSNRLWQGLVCGHH